MKVLKFKFFGFILGTLTVYLILFYSFLDNFTSLQTETFVNLKYVVVHIDLKGAPLKLEYLEGLLPFFKKFGVNGLLMEYEDMFPYDGILVNISARNCYNKTELKNFLIKAAKSQIEIIPLVQTFGHMEHVLKLKEFQYLREEHLYPDSICPSMTNSVRILKDMLHQVIQFHDSIAPLKHIHVGCDEVYHINKCPKCLRRNSKKMEIFLSHLSVIKEIVFSFAPHTSVLVWDDMFRTMKNRWNVRKSYGIHELEPVYWDYTPDLSVSHLNLYNYHNSFNNIWIASAFKGADGRQAVLPNLRDRFLNHYMWMNLILDYIFANERKVFKFKGIILTGWSRYSHMDPLCELFPASLPSLVLNLLLVQKYRFGVNISDTLKNPFDFFNKYLIAELNRDLQCENLIDVDDLPVLMDTCSFETVTLYVLLKQYKLLAADIEAAFSSEAVDLAALEYNSKIQNINMNNVNRSMDWCNSTLKELNDWERNMWRIMPEYYDNFVIEEFIGQKISTLKNKVKNTLDILDTYMGRRIWERKPNNITEL